MGGGIAMGIGFFEIGVAGAALLVLGLLLDAVFEGLFEGLVPSADWMSLPVVGAALTAFGFGASIAHDQLGAATPLALAAGTALALASGNGAARLTRSAIGMATDGTPTSADLVGTEGRVVTPIDGDRAGEVVVRLAGQPMKLSALATEGSDAAFASGAEVVVVSVVSPTRVRVMAADHFWASK